jgi:peptidoglycan/xylan/chitin deacetylase (PgdA/CDA1 family)
VLVIARVLLVLAILATAVGLGVGLLLRARAGVRAAGISAAAAALALFATAAWSVVSLDAPLFGRMINHGPRACRAVALTFDDGPNPPATPQVLDILKRDGAPATFFVVGLRAARAPELLRRIRADGHAIGNHSFAHRPFVLATPGMIRRDLDRTDAVVRAATGAAPSFVRVPYGLRGPFTLRTVRAGGREPVGWSLYPRDARQPPPDTIAARVLERARPGDIILLHDGGGDRANTVAALPRILEGLRARGLPVVPLADLLGGRCEGVPGRLR